MRWNWQSDKWPIFTYNKNQLSDFEAEFLAESSIVFGAYQHIDKNDKKNIIIELITEEAVNTSEIEGEILDRESVQSSIRKNFGLHTNNKKIPQNEKGISDMMIDLYETYDKNLSNEYLYNWHKKLALGRSDIENIGKYRTHDEPMQVVSGPIHKPKIHYEAPPSRIIPIEMERYSEWFNEASQMSANKLNTIINAGIAHLYFVLIHPFEDGNGRIGRALSEKLISSSFHYPVLLSISSIIQKNKKEYYDILEEHNKKLEITDYLIYFSKLILEAQKLTGKTIEFTIKKTKIYDKYSELLNERQLKVLSKIFEAGINGFKGGLSANNYKSIAKHTSDSTVTRDLQGMVSIGLLKKVGELKHARYYVNNL